MFSVIIPAFNAENVIENAIESVLKQTCQEFEIIIIDDGSTDNTKMVINKYKDSRIRYFYQENAGVSSARNKGIINSNYNYICFLDSDDEWKSNHLEVLLNLIKKYNDCGMYITGYDILLNNGETIHKSQKIFKDIKDDDFKSTNGFNIILKYGYFFNTNTVCCKKDVFNKVGLFETGVKNGEDDDMWFRIFSYFDIAVTKNVTTLYNRSNSQATKNRILTTKNIFYDRIDSLLEEADINFERKQGLSKWKENHKISKCRKYILMGNKKETFAIFKNINITLVDKKRYLETLLCFFIPSILIKIIINKRDSNYYR